MLWLSRTFAMSNKLICPMNVRDSGCRLYYSLISTFDASGIGKYRYRSFSQTKACFEAVLVLKNS